MLFLPGNGDAKFSTVDGKGFGILQAIVLMMMMMMVMMMVMTVKCLQGHSLPMMVHVQAFHTFLMDIE